MGTREALFSLQVLFQRCRDVNSDIYACFIDYQKAFDRVQHTKMIQILEGLGLNKKDLRIIVNLYWNQTASVRVNNESTEAVKIMRGVRQGCVLSPVLFNIYSEHIFREALETEHIGVNVNGEILNNLRYADDTVVFANTPEGLQELLDRLVTASEKYGLDVNTDKTKIMVIKKQQDQVPSSLYIKGNKVKQVKTYTYLGTVINQQWDHSQEIKCRIEKARKGFNDMSKLFKSHDVGLHTKIRMIRCYVFSVLYYGMEAWTLTEASTRKLEAFEMWLYRRILRIPWVDKVPNAEVLRRMGKEMEVLNTIKCRKLEYLGHIMRHPEKYHLLQLILQGKIQGRRGPGRRRISWLKNLRTWFGKTTSELFRAAANKIIIAGMVANIRNG